MKLQPQSINLKDCGLELSFYGKLQKSKVPLVFIHGAGGNGLLWEQQLSGLSGSFSTIALDLPGHGKSRGNPCPSISLYREVIRDFKESLNLSSFVICGHSMGGAIAMDYHFKYPHDLQAIILVGTGGRLRVAAEILDRFGRGDSMPGMAELLFGSDAPPQMVRDGEKYIAMVPAEVWYTDFTACNNFDLLDDLHRINIPTLVLCGVEDRMTPPKYSRYLHENIPGAVVELFAGSGHMLMMEKPGEVNHAIEKFLSGLKQQNINLKNG
ncbi:MAG: alpha/beta hydrolase [Bacillota bacterium]